jgi:hypothetical protein
MRHSSRDISGVKVIRIRSYKKFRNTPSVSFSTAFAFFPGVVVVIELTSKVSLVASAKRPPSDAL